VLDDLFGRLYSKIRQLASRVRWKGANPTLNATALAHEAYLKLLKDPPDLASKSSDEVIAVFANAMRQILIDAARRKKAQKRDPVSAPENTPLPVEDALTIDALAQDLKRENPRQGQVVDCRFYLGMTVDETAAALGLSKTMVEREWREARARLGARVQPGKG
jgi:RNA polymerase sigma factor (TIGR02999 family)